MQTSNKRQNNKVNNDILFTNQKREFKSFLEAIGPRDLTIWVLQSFIDDWDMIIDFKNDRKYHIFFFSFQIDESVETSD